MAKVILFNKPYLVLTQFRQEIGKQTLANYIFDPSLRVAGRLDADSEGLLLLTDDGNLNHYLTSPEYKAYKYYWVQVEGAVTETAITQLQRGVLLNDGVTLPAIVEIIAEPENLWQRTPPIRERKAIPTTWLNIGIREGRNRQIRRMTAHVGFPTLRLIRHQIGDYQINQLQPSEQCALQVTVPHLPTQTHNFRKKSLKK